MPDTDRSPGTPGSHPIYLEDKLREVRESGRLEYRSRSMPTWCPGC